MLLYLNKNKAKKVASALKERFRRLQDSRVIPKTMENQISSFSSFSTTDEKKKNYIAQQIFIFVAVL